jgi:hypothetical protein
VIFPCYGLAQVLLEAQRLKRQAAAQAAEATEAARRARDAHYDQDVIDVDARVIEDVPALPAPENRER